MFKIGDFSKLTNLTVKALRHYEEKGLLFPEYIDEESKYRYYSAQQLKTVNQIKLLQDIGLSLKTIKEILETNDVKHLEYYYKLREEEMKEERDDLERKQALLHTYLSTMKEDKTMNKYNVELKEIPERKVMSLRQSLKNYEDEGILWENLYEQSLKQKIKLSNPPLGLTIYHDKDYKDHDIDVEIQSSVEVIYDDMDGVLYTLAPAFIMASVTFNGSFDQMPQVTEAIAQWIEASDYTISGPMVNISHVSPAQDPDPENWITESGFIVSKK